MIRRFLLAVLLAVWACLALGSPALAAGAIRLTVTPNVLLADGISTATVNAEVRTRSGRPVRDGTEVRFYTTAGSITQVAHTSAGVARATLTASSVPQAATVTVSSGPDQAVISVPMVAKLAEANVDGRVLRVGAEYVAFSEDERFIQADGKVRLRFRGLSLEANSVQIDLNRDVLKAFGKVHIASDEKFLIADRLWLDLGTFEGHLVSVETRQWFSGYGLTEIPEPMRKTSIDFEVEDLSDSRLLWVGKQATYVIGERVQVQGARAYVGGIKSLRIPHHEADLRQSFGSTNQYVGFGTQGLNVDLPLYLTMSPQASTALRVVQGARTGGVGRFTRQQGLSVDLVQKYGFSGASEGEAAITNLNSLDRLGMFWLHTHRLNQNTRLVANFQFPQHRDIYGQLNLTSGLRFGTLQAAVGASKPRNRDLSKSISLGFESKPRTLLDGKLRLSAETSYYLREASEVRVARGVRIPVRDVEYQTIGLRLRPESIKLPLGFTLDSGASLRAVSGNSSNRGFGPAIDLHLRRSVRNGGNLALGLTYNHLTTVSELYPTVGKLNGTLSLSYPITDRLQVMALGNMALDAESRNSILQVTYQVTPSWRLDLLHTLYSYGPYGDFDYQIGIARSIGEREIALYWSRLEHRWILEFGASRF